MKIAFMGIRGVPANYGGFETFVEEFGSRLAEKGHCVTVYNRSNWVKYIEKTYRGMRLIRLPAIQNKHLDTISHTFLSMLHAIFNKYDMVYICGVGNSPLSFIPRIFGCKTILNVDGLDWQREKWGKIAKLYLKTSEYLATILANIIITDSKTIQEYYIRKYNKQTVYIPYGVNIEQTPGMGTQNDKFLNLSGIEKGKYILFVGRLVPENGAHYLIESYLKLKTDLKLVIVGDAPYSKRYIRFLKSFENKNIIFTGYLFGDRYRQLSSHASIFVLPSKSGGTRPVLLEQMALGNCILVNEIQQNLETIGEAGCSYSEETKDNSLKDKLEYLINNPLVREAYGKKAVEWVKREYSWDNIADSYEQLFKLTKND
ncbi:MAG: glycosyltransferase [Candidatus Omnitrophica bacterium]|nr:glycosyltransferase [Candidatus Omnitrophota bacterium]